MGVDRMRLATRSKDGITTQKTLAKIRMILNDLIALFKIMRTW